MCAAQTTDIPVAVQSPLRSHSNSRLHSSIATHAGLIAVWRARKLCSCCGYQPLTSTVD